MSKVYIVTGKLGSGKTAGCVGKIRDYLNENRAVATNLDLTLEKLVNPWAKKTRVTRLPDKPTLEDLENLPTPYKGAYDESKTGLIVLDECGTWFNTRKWSDKQRQPLIDKLLHIRKAGWDVMFIIQHIEMLDKQVREGLGEHVVYCQRADRLSLPFITAFLRLLGSSGRPPKIHICIVRYGTQTTGPLVDRWVYTGKDLYDAYDTRQVFGSNDCALHTVLPPYYVFGRYVEKSVYAKKELKKKTKAFTRRAKRAGRPFFLLGALVATSVTAYAMSGSDTEPTKAQSEMVEPEPEKTEETTETEEPVNPFDYIRIYASEKTNQGYEYYFKDEYSGTKYYPESKNLKIWAIDSCHAKLIDLNESHIITCSPKKAVQAR